VRLIIAGSRNFNDYDFLEQEMRHYLKISDFITVVLSGCAKGADTLGLRWAANKRIPIERHPAKWEVHGKAAGIRRNCDMAANADALVAFWDGESKGTKHMIDHAEFKGLKVYVVRIEHLLKQGTRK
jgi:hypothetical protein